MAEKTGRPRVCPTEVSTDVHLTLSASQYDRAYAAASLARVTVPEFIRRLLASQLETQSSQS